MLAEEQERKEAKRKTLHKETRDQMADNYRNRIANFIKDVSKYPPCLC